MSGTVVSGSIALPGVAITAVSTDGRKVAASATESNGTYELRLPGDGHFTLNAWAMDGYQGIFWYGKDVVGILPEIGVLTGIAVVTSLLAWRLWERRMRV